MALINWNSRQDFIPSLLDNLRWDSDLMNGFWNGTHRPAVNISETEDTYLIEVAAPGLQKKDFSISVEGNMLSIKVEKESKSEKKDKDYWRQEYDFSSFERSFRLPEDVMSDKVKANYQNGLLEISLQKIAVKKPKKIEVSVS
jgi:HSP20 family protein